MILHTLWKNTACITKKILLLFKKHKVICRRTCSLCSRAACNNSGVAKQPMTTPFPMSSNYIHCLAQATNSLLCKTEIYLQASNTQTTVIVMIKVVKDWKCLANLERVLAAVSWLANPNSLQHARVPQLSEHQAIAEPQGQLKGKNIYSQYFLELQALGETSKHANGSMVSAHVTHLHHMHVGNDVERECGFPGTTLIPPGLNPLCFWRAIRWRLSNI